MREGCGGKDIPSHACKHALAGSAWTVKASHGLLANHCRATDNRMIERLWRSLKYECIYLNAFETGPETRAGIEKWIAYYNVERPHSTHGILTPDEAYDRKMEPMSSAA
jgi:putative transposase